MNSKPATYNYSLLRYLPYRQTGEFVNVGVVAACVQPAMFGFWMDGREALVKVHALFPELNRLRFEAGYEAMRRELERIKAQVMDDREPKTVSRFFGELVRPRESSFRFGEIRTISTSRLDSAALAEDLFERYVRRKSTPVTQVQKLPEV